MADTTEKVYCFDNPSNSAQTAMLASLMNGQKPSPAELMALANNGGLGNNNGFIFLFLLLLFGMGGWNGGGFGNNGVNQNSVNDQLSAIRNQLNENQNSSLLREAIGGNQTALQQLTNNLGLQFGQVNSAISGIQNAITQVSGQTGLSSERVINAVQMGDSNLTSALQQSCCNMRTELLNQSAQTRLENCQQTNALQNTINGTANNLAFAMQQGFNGVSSNFAQQNYNIASLGCEIKQNSTTNTQRIIDTMNAHWSQEMQDRLFRYSQEAQTAQILSAINSSKSST